MPPSLYPSFPTHREVKEDITNPCDVTKVISDVIMANRVLRYGKVGKGSKGKGEEVKGWDGDKKKLRERK